MKKSKISLYIILFLCLVFSVSSCNTDSSKEDKTNQETSLNSDSNSKLDSDTNSAENNYSNNGNSTTINNEQQPNSIRPVYSNSDANTDDQNLSIGFSAKDSAEFFKRFAPKTQTFKIFNDQEQDIYCDLGTYIHIDAGSFVFEDGSPVTSPVTVEVKEFYDKKTVLLAGLATNTKGGFLESGGMLHIQATAMGKKVKLQKEMTIQMPTYATNTKSKNGMKVYLASNSSNNSNSAALNNVDKNDVNNPPSVWESDGTEIGITRIPEKRDFYNLRFLYKKDSVDDSQTVANNCECDDVSLVSEKIEALSEQVDVEKSKKYQTTFRTINPTLTDQKVITPKMQSKFTIGKDTIAYEDYRNYTTAFATNLDKEDFFFYDTIQLAIEINKEGTAKVIEQIKQTNHGTKNISIIRSINSASGLRLNASTSKSGICKGQAIGFYVQSVDLWKEILEKGEDQFKNWRNSQRKSEENYTISYKKRKKPILVWTGIIKTTRKAFVQDYKMTRTLKYYHQSSDKTKQAAYDAYRQKHIDRYEQYMEKNKATLAATRSLDSYIFKTADLGWINCDRFYEVPDEQKVNLLVNSHTPVRVIFSKINAVMQGTQIGRYNKFGSIPQGEAITIFGVRKKGEKLYMAFEQTKVGKTAVDLVYKETTIDEMEKVLATL